MGCALHGEFPISIFYLPNLQVLNLVHNPKLIGHFPDFKSNSPLETLWLRGTKFSGQFPVSIGSLHSLVDFDIHGCEFFGSIPPSIYNLSQLRVLSLGYNQLTGTFPSQILHLSKLTYLNIRHNKFRGPISSSIFDHRNLEYLDLSHNEFSGIMKFEMFSKLKNLTGLFLSNNQLSLLIDETDSPSTLPRFQSLGLNSCNLSSFPNFLRDQHKLEWLELAGNNISGLFPKWMWDCGKETLKLMNISVNSLIGFEQPPVILPWVSLSLLDLSNNMFQGSLPIPQFSTLYYSASNNSLTGEISSLICNMSSLQVLDLSENYLSGSIPQCLFNFSYSLQALNLKRNNLSGSIPQSWIKANKLSFINLSQNKLQNQVPRSLANCTLLENLDLGDNQLNDIFPSYLAALPNLKVLILRSNKLYGPINDSETSETSNGFPKLHILDLSYNSFSGEFPFKLFQNWIGRKNVDAHSLTYINVSYRFETMMHVIRPQYDYALTITNKGIRLAYDKVQEDFNAIDISSNKYEGEIPGFIGDLKELNLLNLSNNNLVGCIPASIGNLLKLESLDFSENKLSGDLPQELVELNFLEFFNVSFNNLKGPIPRGRQFETFGNNSFLGNAELCGSPLTRKCANLGNSPPLPSTTEEEEHGLFGCDWKIIMLGYGCGLVIGFSIGYTVITRKSYWFTKIRRRSRRLHRRVNRRGCRI
ncbi:Receptor-like protein [Quillaja saponaria]|uniref:Receptor-like protein n=1 Tax=Quillaja saponaria TaxID=32244 RepID=A0AAD7PU04_QUISA|nr:Receptor-like protein [Quillaja saponaria]